jgi:hypothetical protein
LLRAAEQGRSVSTGRESEAKQNKKTEKTKSSVTLNTGQICRSQFLRGQTKIGAHKTGGFAAESSAKI